MRMSTTSTRENDFLGHKLLNWNQNPWKKGVKDKRGKVGVWTRHDKESGGRGGVTKKNPES